MMAMAAAAAARPERPEDSRDSGRDSGRVGQGAFDATSREASRAGVRLALASDSHADTDAGRKTGRGRTADELVRDLQEDMAAEARVRLRERLLRQPVDWLVDELMARLQLDAADPLAKQSTPLSAPAFRPALTPAQAAPSTSAAASASASGLAGARPPRAAAESAIAQGAAMHAPSVRLMPLDESALHAFLSRHHALTRERLEAGGYLHPGATPCQGTQLIGPHCRTAAGEALLREAKALLDALLFGDEPAGVRLTRVQRELLTITLARPKADALARLLRAATEIDAEGTWHDPAHVSHDTRAPNTVIEVEYGETASEIVGRGIALALRLINDLEINEQVLYARMTNIEDSSLAPPA